MRFDPFRFLIKLEDRHPKLARALSMRCLGLMAPFNAHLKAEMLDWDEGRCVIRLRRHRGVKNHVGGIHAGALFTLGETCAGLAVIRSFPFEKYRPLMSEVRVEYNKQARGDVIGEAVIAPAEIARMKSVIDGGEVPFTEVVTNISNQEGEIIAAATTTWQIKRWDMIRVPGNA